uniref:Uncharacterized protein n=1 Tax=Leviviridae sp. TaxID=2027243 RepID=A0A514CYU4_9VIRU|nr:MAG: hypothetical protein H1Rhizo273194_000002 [Leviviridae sp.]
MSNYQVVDVEVLVNRTKKRIPNLPDALMTVVHTFNEVIRSYGYILSEGTAADLDTDGAILVSFASFLKDEQNDFEAATTRIYIPKPQLAGKPEEVLSPFSWKDISRQTNKFAGFWLSVGSEIHMIPLTGQSDGTPGALQS